MGLISNGTTIFDAGAMSVGGSMTFIKKLTASSSGTLSFVDGSSSVVLDSTYKEYIFIFNNIHPATGNTQLTFQGNAAGGSGYNETITSTAFMAFHLESGGSGTLGYEAGRDLGQSTGFQDCTGDIGAENDECGSGFLHLFNPSGTTFVKHFIGRASSYHPSDRENDFYTAGYFNTTSAIDEIQFKMSSGNIDSGTITLYGIN
tara:strand:- start:34 stop:642 length:609 start_codon:yes stop_codon:yes gene_type:complete